MAARFVVSALGLLSALTSTANAALPTITTKGTKFFDSNGNQFFFKGVAYQLLPTDPLVDTTQCQLDATLMKTLGANSIRVYHVDPWANHDGCMAAFDAAGIYALIDLDTFNTTVTESTPMWTQEQFQAYAHVMDVFSGYSNVAGFYIGNEIINEAGDSTLAAPYIKASTADMKAYQAKMGYRRIPIGYSHADVLSLRPGLQNYLVCGDSSAAIDFFSLNAYEWCGTQTYETSGYEALENATAYYPAPIFISETGCNQPAGRTFQDQNAIFGPMSTTWSGSIVYEWIQEDNQYGLITYGGGNTNALNSAAPAGGYSRSGTPTPVTPDFSNLEAVWKTVMPEYSTSSAAYTPNVTPVSCPASTAGGWEVDPNASIPTLGAAAVTAAAATSGTSGTSATSSRVSSAASAASSSASSARSSLTSAASSAASSASSLRSSLQSSATATAAAAASATSATSATSAKSGAAVGMQVPGASTGLSGLILGLLMWL